MTGSAIVKQDDARYGRSRDLRINMCLYRKLVGKNHYVPVVKFDTFQDSVVEGIFDLFISEYSSRIGVRPPPKCAKVDFYVSDKDFVACNSIHRNLHSVKGGHGGTAMYVSMLFAVMEMKSLGFPDLEAYLNFKNALASAGVRSFDDYKKFVKSYGD